MNHGRASNTHASTVDTSQYTQAGREGGLGGGGHTGRMLVHTVYSRTAVLDDLMCSISFVKLQGYVPDVRKPLVNMQSGTFHRAYTVALL